MKQEQIKQIILESILAVKTHLNPKELVDHSSLTEDLGFDSMGLVALASELEKRFNRSLPLTKWLEMQKDKKLSLGSLVEFLYMELK